MSSRSIDLEEVVFPRERRIAMAITLSIVAFANVTFLVAWFA